MKRSRRELSIDMIINNGNLNPTSAQRCRSETEKFILEGLL